MSSPTYIHIPNLIGGQILRIPVQDSDLDLNLPTTIPTTTFPPRDTSPAPSITSSSSDSVDEEE